MAGERGDVIGGTDGQTLDEALAAAGEQERDLAAELAAASDRALRLQAEMQNLRSRTSRARRV